MGSGISPTSVMCMITKPAATGVMPCCEYTDSGLCLWTHAPPYAVLIKGLQWWTCAPTWMH